MQEKNPYEDEFNYLASYIILKAMYEEGVISAKRFEIMNKVSALNYCVPPISDDLAHSSNSF